MTLCLLNLLFFTDLSISLISALEISLEWTSFWAFLRVFMRFLPCQSCLFFSSIAVRRVSKVLEEWWVEVVGSLEVW